MTQDDRMETITDPAVIRACDEPDERGERGDFPCCTDRTHKESLGGDSESGTYNRSNRPPAGPCTDERTTPAPSSGAGPDLGALHETICDKFTGMAEVRQAADLLVAEVRSLRANWRMVTTALGYGDGITEPQIEHRDFVAECERQFAEASEWRESQRWRDECHDAGHPDDEDCYEHDPALVLLTLRAKVAALQVAVSHSAESCADGPCEFHETVARAESAEAKVAAVEAVEDSWSRRTLPWPAWPHVHHWLRDLRAALATTGEGL